MTKLVNKTIESKKKFHPAPQFFRPPIRAQRLSVTLDKAEDGIIGRVAMWLKAQDKIVES